MLRNIILLYLFFFIGFINAQNFEGRIDYLFLNKPTSTSINFFEEFYIKNDKAKTQRYLNEIKFNGYSLNIKNSYYNVNVLEEKIGKNFKSLSINNIQKKDVNLKKLNKKEIILGYNCTIYKENRNTIFGKDIVFYSIADSLKADKSNGSRNVKNGRIVLKHIQKTDGGTYEVEAIEVKEMKLDDKLFELPDYPIKEVDFEKLSKQYTR